MEFPFTLEIAKKYGWRDKNTDLVWFRRWLESNFDIEEDYNYDLLSQPIVLAEHGGWKNNINPYEDKILVLERWDGEKHKLYFPVKNNMIPRGDGFVNGIFVKIKFLKNNSQMISYETSTDTFIFARGWHTFASPTYTDRYNGIFGRNATYTILGVFEYKPNNFMNWNDNPLR